jgi:hypothetical protein
MGTPQRLRAMGHMATPEPSHTGRRGSRAARHMATPEPFPVGSRAQCHGARDDARALLHQEVGLEPRDIW